MRYLWIVIVLLFFSTACFGATSKTAVRWQFDADKEFITRIKQLLPSKNNDTRQGVRQLWYQIDIDIGTDKTISRVRKAWFFPNSQALQDSGNERIAYDELSERVIIHEAASIGANGRLTRFDPAKARIVESDSYDVFTSIKEIVLPYPNVEVGETALVDYEIVSDHKLQESVWMPVIFPQQLYPRDNFRLRVKWPNEIQRNWISTSKAVVCRDEATELVCEGHDIPAVARDYDVAWQDELGQILLSGPYTTWDDVIVKVRHAFDTAFDDVSGAEKIVAELTRNVKSVEDKITILQQFAARNIRYVSYSETGHAITPHHVAETLTNRYGDCKDKSALMIELLRHIGVKAHPVLLATHRSVPEALKLPGLSYFNHMVVCFDRDGKTYCLDATDAHTHWRTIPNWIQGRVALDLKAGEKPRSFAADTYRWNMIINTKITFSSDGGLSERQSRIFQGTYAGWMRHTLAPKNPEEMKRWAVEQYKERVSNETEPVFVFTGIDTLEPTLHLSSTANYTPVLNIAENLTYTEVDAWLRDELLQAKIKNKIYGSYFAGLSIRSNYEFDTAGYWRLDSHGATLHLDGKYGSMVRNISQEGPNVVKMTTEVRLPARKLSVAEASSFNNYLDLLKREAQMQIYGKPSKK